MGRARRARRIAQRAAYGGGVGVAGLGALSALGYGLIKAEVLLARRIVGQPFEGAPDDSGTYGFGPGDPIRLLLVGDSTAKGMGTENARQTIGAIISNGVAAITGRSVELTNVAVVGAESLDLDGQLDDGLGRCPTPDVAVILVGANDVTHRIDKSVAVRHLEMAVQRLRESDAEVVVGTCPDLGAIDPIAQPLKLLARRWSRDLAAAQTVAVVEAGGRAVSIGDLLGAVFSDQPKVMFSKDQYHPSPAGYARVAAALLPSVLAALDLPEWAREDDREAASRPSLRRGEGVGPVAVAATRAVAHPGTEVAPAEVAGQQRGPEGRWAMLLHRVRPIIPNLDRLDRGPRQVDGESPDGPAPAGAAGEGASASAGPAPTPGPSGPDPVS